MTAAEEQSHELIKKFAFLFEDGESYQYVRLKAKQCALIAVDEILSLRMINTINRDLTYNEGTFWEEVKFYINKS